MQSTRTDCSVDAVAHYCMLQICRARLANVEIPDNKCVRYSLQYIYGVGDTTAQRVLDAVGIDYTKRVYELSEDEMGQIRAELENYTIESDLRRIISMNIKRCASGCGCLSLFCCNRGVACLTGLCHSQALHNVSVSFKQASSVQKHDLQRLDDGNIAIDSRF